MKGVPCIRKDVCFYLPTPWKIKRETPQNGGLEEDFPFQLGEFLASMLIFRGV